MVRYPIVPMPDEATFQQPTARVNGASRAWGGSGSRNPNPARMIGAPVLLSRTGWRMKSSHDRGISRDLPGRLIPRVATGHPARGNLAGAAPARSMTGSSDAPGQLDVTLLDDDPDDPEPNRLLGVLVENGVTP